MSTIHLVLTGSETNFKVCAAFTIAKLAQAYATGFHHHTERVWVQEIDRGVDQDLRVGDKPFIVRFNRSGECQGVFEEPPIHDFTWNAPPHRISEDGETVDVFRWAPDAKSAQHEAEARLEYAPLSDWVQGAPPARR